MSVVGNKAISHLMLSGEIKDGRDAVHNGSRNILNNAVAESQDTAASA